MAGKLTGSPWIWKDGEIIRWEDANVHILSLAVQFGASVFEGVRCYETPNGPAVFRLHDHFKRLMVSSRTYRMQPPHTIDELVDATLATIRRNELKSCYVRPMVLRGYGASSMHPRHSPIETYIPMWPWGAYLGEEGLKRGVDVCVSSWNRPAPNTIPSGAKSAGNYILSSLMVMEAVAHGYVEAIGLGPTGLVSEGSGQNLFLVMGRASSSRPFWTARRCGESRATACSRSPRSSGSPCASSWSRARCSTAPTRCSSPGRRRK